MSVSRRVWMAGAGALALGVALPLYFSRKRRVNIASALPASEIPEFRLHEGFTATLIDRAADVMSDGFVVPGSPDGMAVLDHAGGNIILMRNHELREQSALSAYGTKGRPSEAYSTRMFGAVTRVVVAEKDNRVVSSNLVVTGTAQNCAGGPSPWGWFTCEEHVEGPHGWVFLCDHRAETVQQPNRIEAYGRFRHEAVGIDLDTSDAYLTEDLIDGCLYRFRATSKDTPFEGKLQALCVGRTNVDEMRPGDAVEVFWVDVTGTDSPEDDLRKRSAKLGAAQFRRGEGVYSDRRDGKVSIYFTATAGGRFKQGQLFRLEPTTEGGTLTVVVEAVGGDELEMPDNVCVSPAGHVFLAEDGSPPNGLLVACPSGKLVTLAVNLGAGELAGVTFVKDRLFVNLQRRGLTLVIRGPFSELG